MKIAAFRDLLLLGALAAGYCLGAYFYGERLVRPQLESQAIKLYQNAELRHLSTLLDVADWVSDTDKRVRIGEELDAQVILILGISLPIACRQLYEMNPRTVQRLITTQWARRTESILGRTVDAQIAELAECLKKEGSLTKQ